MSNFLYILLIGPMIEEKFGTKNLLLMMILTSLIIGIFNFIFSKKRILGASGIVYMLITLSSAVNIENGKIPLILLKISTINISKESYDNKLEEKCSIIMRGLAYRIYITRYRKYFTTNLGTIQFNLYMNIEYLNLYLRKIMYHIYHTL